MIPYLFPRIEPLPGGVKGKKAEEEKGFFCAKEVLDRGNELP
jgi:hypothetical protein